MPNTTQATPWSKRLVMYDKGWILEPFREKSKIDENWDLEISF